jgi:hypothetical protein
MTAFLKSALVLVLLSIAIVAMVIILFEEE